MTDHHFSLSEWIKILPDDGTYHYLVTTYDGIKFRTYVDGVEK